MVDQEHGIEDGRCREPCDELLSRIDSMYEEGSDGGYGQRRVLTDTPETTGTFGRAYAEGGPLAQEAVERVRQLAERGGLTGLMVTGGSGGGVGSGLTTLLLVG